LSSKTARTVVTGGTRGIGAAVVRRLARSPEGRLAGHEVVALGFARRPEPPNWTSELGANRRTVTFDACDVSDARDTGETFARANGDGEGLTGLVVSAGVWEPSGLEGSVEEICERYRRVI
jgi:NAD(P)-dependent dehydrogenase (short-subunit alcohol dehydrogenase family)